MRLIPTIFKSLTITAILGVSLSSCTSTVSVQVLKPADINIPDSINKFVLANRSLPSEDQQLGNIVEGLFSGEGIGSDKRSSGEALVGLTNGLAKSPRFDVTQSTEQLYGTGTAQMPAPLDWQKVEEICTNSNSDALVLLEVFDTDSKRTFDTRVKTRTIEGVKHEYTEHVANLDMTVTTGWRIYFPSTKMIIDNYVFDDGKTFSSNNEDYDKARSGLPNKERAAREAGFVAGESYALRISPMWVRIGRNYYTKGSPDMKMATRRAKSQDWVGASEIWRKLGESSAKLKIKKRACYNMALACEIEGKMDLAITWAKKARDLGMKSAINRINQLEQRKRDDARANDQMGG